jgi:4-hydroxy-tetrahydrodipicolinate reductase
VIKVGVVGAGGKMGREVCRAVRGDSDLELVAAVDPRFEGTPLGELTGVDHGDLQVGQRLEDLADASVSVVVDFTVASVALETLRWCAANEVHAVVGTTGLSDEDLTDLTSLFGNSGANCVVAPNFAIGAVLMMKFAELAAEHMDGAEIVELHHDDKLDAPSGTAVTSAARIASARSRGGLDPWPGDRTESWPLPGSRGAEAPGGVRVHSVRLRGLVAHQEVLFGATGQTLSIRHDAYDRTCFMPGVLLAVKSVSARPGLTIGLDALLGLGEASPEPGDGP